MPASKKVTTTKKKESADKQNQDSKSSRLNLFYIIMTLKKYSSKDHPMTVEEIREKAEKDYDLVFGKDTVDKQLEAMVNSSLQLIDVIDEFADAQDQTDTSYADKNYGFHIGMMKIDKEKNDEKDAVINVSAIKKYKYYYDSCLNDDELKTLVKAISAYSHAEQKEKKCITKKIAAIKPSKKNILSAYIYDNASLETDICDAEHENLTTLQEIINENRWALITTSYYDADMNPIITDHTETTFDIHDPVDDDIFDPKKKGTKAKKTAEDLFDIKTHIVLPVPGSISFRDGHYYCRVMTLKEITKDEPKPNNDHEFPEKTVNETIRIRLDLCSIEKLHIENDEFIANALSGVKIDIPDHFEHYAGTAGPVKGYYLLIRVGEKSQFMNVAIGTFGKFVEPPKVRDPERVKKLLGYLPKPLEENEKWAELRVKNTEEGILQFASQHCQNVLIVDKDLRAKLKERINRALV